MQYKNTINNLLDKLNKEVSFVETDDLLETYKTVYPNSSVLREEKNFIINEVEMTIPYATSRGAKTLMKKDNSHLLEIFNDINRGDLLKVKEIKGNKVIVENISIKKEYKKDFEIDKLDIIKGDFKVVKRLSVGLYESIKKLELE